MAPCKYFKLILCSTLSLSYLMNVNCSSYIQGLRARLGYFPNGGTIRLNTRAMHTNTAGRTICKENQSELIKTELY